MTAQVDANDPGVFYIMHQPAGMTSFHEGKEWTITFGTTDTLGHRYNHPVSMNMAGGEFYDSLSIAIDEIDSILMYQPKPIYQEGVFVIDETNVGDIISVDSTMTIIWFRKDAQTYPQIGQHIVSDLSEPPLPYGFLGVASELNDQGDYVECICNGKWEQLSEFYVSCIKSISTYNGDTKGKARQRRDARRVLPKNTKKVIDFDDDWNQFFKISKSGNLLEPEHKEGNIEASASLKFGGSITLYYKIQQDYVVEGGTDKDKHFAFHQGIDIAPGKLEFNGKIEAIVPYGNFGKKIKKSLSAFDVEAKAGFFIYAKANLDAALEIPSFRAVCHVCPGLLFSNAFSSEFDGYEFKIGGAKVEISGEVSPMRLMFQAEATYKGSAASSGSEGTTGSEGATGSEGTTGPEEAAVRPKSITSATNEGDSQESGNQKVTSLKANADITFDILNIKGNFTTTDYSFDYSDEDPKSLLAHYNHFENAHSLTVKGFGFSGSVGANYSIKKGIFSTEAELSITPIDVNAYEYRLLRSLPLLSVKTSHKSAAGTELEFSTNYAASEHSIVKRKCELWVYNHSSKEWQFKFEEGMNEGSWSPSAFVNNDFVQMPTQSYSLRKGTCYSVCPAIFIPYSAGASSWGVYTSPQEEKILAPYIITTEDAKIDFSTAYGRMTVDPIAVKDCQDGLHTFEVGFQCAKNKEDLPYADKKKISFQYLEERMTQAVLHEPNAERWYRAYMIVDGLEDLAIYGEPKKFKTRNDECPSTQEATDITYTSAKLRALVNDQILSMFHASDQTKLGFVYNMGTTFGINPGRAGGKNGEVPFDSQYTYYHIYQNLYPDCDYSFAAFIIRPPADWSSPDKPDEEIDVPLRFHTKNPFNPITGDNFTTYFKTQITGEVNQWVLDHFYDEHYKGFEVYFRFGKTIESMKRVELDTPIGESTTVFAAIDNLDNDQDYVYQLCIDTNYPYGKRPYRGEIKTLHVPDAYKMDTWQPDPIGARTATFHGNMNEYIAQELTTMKEVKYYFAYSTDKNAVEQLKNPHKVAATRNGQNFTANASGLHYHSLHYCRIVAEGYDKDDIICANLIQFKGNVVEFETPEIFKPQSLTAYPTPKGLAFKVTMLPEAEEIINAGEEIVQMTVRYAQDRSQLKTPDNAHDVVMTWRCDKSDPADVKYYFCDSVPVLDVNHGYYYRAVSDYQGHISTLDSYNPTVVSVPTVEVTTGEATFDFDDARVDMQGHIQTSMPLHLERYQTDFICSFEYSTFEGYLPEGYEAVIVENDDPSDDVHDVQAQYNPATQDFQAMDVYMPSGDDDAVDYFYRGVFTQDTYPADPKVFGQVLSCTVYYYDPGVMAYIAPRYRDAQGQWQRTALPADIQRKLDKRRAERAAAGRRFDGTSIRN